MRAGGKLAKHFLLVKNFWLYGNVHAIVANNVAIFISQGTK